MTHIFTIPRKVASNNGRSLMSNRSGMSGSSKYGIRTSALTQSAREKANATSSISNGEGSDGEIKDNDHHQHYHHHHHHEADGGHQHHDSSHDMNHHHISLTDPDDTSNKNNGPEMSSTPSFFIPNNHNDLITYSYTLKHPYRPHQHRAAHHPSMATSKPVLRLPGHLLSNSIASQPQHVQQSPAGIEFFPTYNNPLQMHRAVPIQQQPHLSAPSVSSYQPNPQYILAPTQQSTYSLPTYPYHHVESNGMRFAPTAATGVAHAPAILRTPGIPSTQQLQYHQLQQQPILNAAAPSAPATRGFFNFGRGNSVFSRLWPSRNQGGLSGLLTGQTETSPAVFSPSSTSTVDHNRSYNPLRSFFEMLGLKPRTAPLISHLPKAYYYIANPTTHQHAATSTIHSQPFVGVPSGAAQYEVQQGHSPYLNTAYSNQQQAVVLQPRQPVQMIRKQARRLG